MGFLGCTIASGVDLHPPFDAIGYVGIGVDDALAQLLKVLEHIVELVIFGDNLMDSIEVMLLRLVISTLIIDRLNVADKLVAFRYQLLLSGRFEFSADILPEGLQKLDLFCIGIVLLCNLLLFFLELLLQSFDDGQEILLNEVLFVADLHHKFLHL